jgi:periplasmic protein CpxP/Spy
MTKLRLYKLLTMLLFVGNVALLAFIWQSGSHRPPKSPKEIIAVKLNLNADQMQHYEALINSHRAELKTKEEKMRTLKLQLFQTLSSSDTLNQEAEIVAELGTVHMSIEKAHLKHFKSLKALCTPAQIPLFDELSKDLAKILAPPPRKNPKD